ncbi:hypothetical protein TorRG33x02_272760 [Trema orientale]|uniref:Uncharacterized protein n=1 Tax=Trema orientale TaxID=63057 RepID=A0A2P5CUD5_TREOI|nr:hypothetical protein TorRG33x02_272760 [Trema orientale]
MLLPLTKLAGIQKLIKKEGEASMAKRILPANYEVLHIIPEYKAIGWYSLILHTGNMKNLIPVVNWGHVKGVE